LPVWLENAYSRPFLGGFWGYDPLDGTQYQPIPQKFNLQIISSSSSVLLILVSVVVSEKLPGQKRCDEEAEEEEEHEFLGVFDVFLQ